MKADPQVLIAGAGPTGLVLALYLAKFGIPFRIIDKAVEPGTTSRALVVHARTLELYRQLGIAEKVVSAGKVMTCANLWTHGNLRARVNIGEIGKGLSPFPFLLVYPQDEHEKLLIEALERLGVAVERETELSGFVESGGKVTAKLRKANGREESCVVSYLAGSDGARSKVREGMGSGFPGSTYEHLFYVADIEGEGTAFNHELHVALEESDFLAIFGMKGEGRARLVGIVVPSAEKKEKIEWADVSSQALTRLQLKVKKVNWFSTYHVHHRVTERFHKGNVFLLGDAAHIHSPVGGQGMNTGIGDAANLAWKLAMVLKGQAPGSLLETYALERKAFAERLVQTTDRAFTAVTSSSFTARFTRLQIVPLLLPALARLNAVRRLVFRTVSQIAIHYRNSPLSEGSAGIQGGDRLPWLRFPDGTHNFSDLDTAQWQLHVYGAATPELLASCQQANLPVRVFAWQGFMASMGLRKNASYLIRPDGYVALAKKSLSVAELAGYLSGRNLRF
jgi:2-polyprenyl-6-methoxyphenol hydroxylase-like FAD-dependent oxidoreductase